jgi:hypothetical protein
LVVQGICSSQGCALLMCHLQYVLAFYHALKMKLGKGKTIKL